jgi:prepilin-type N-terminal cleavage/methylation domain-containing protein
MRYARNNLSHRRRGFTLIEASLTTVIVGVGFVAMLQLFAAGTAANVKGTVNTTGINLAKNVREMSLKLKFAQLISLNNKTYSPAVDSRGEALSDFSNWSQSVVVHPVDPDKLTLDISDADPDAVRVTVTVNHNGSKVCDLTWFSLKGAP